MIHCFPFAQTYKYRQCAFRVKCLLNFVKISSINMGLFYNIFVALFSAIGTPISLPLREPANFQSFKGAFLFG